MRKERFSAKKNKLQDFINKRSKILIVVHRSPDGDALGSMLGWYHYLVSVGKKVSMWVPDAFPTTFDWMPGISLINNFEDSREQAREELKEAELIFCLDFNSFSRTGKMGRFISASKAAKVLVDHHREPDSTFTLRFHDVEASSACELVFNIIELLEGEISLDMAECLYTGLITDTGSFRYSTTVQTLAAASKLIEAGVDNSKLQNKIFNVKTFESLKLRGYALSEKLRYLDEYNAGYIFLSKDDLETYNYNSGDTEGLVNEILGIKGVKMAVLFSEKEGEVRISFRSVGDFDVNEIASKYFGGGGHKNAAGARSQVSLEETEKIILTIMDDYGTQLKA
ncbi:MAG: phosphoesterase RecJ-like protein [Patiriisocius sp.]|jgi:phosphoesterase RecJ-like protein